MKELDVELTKDEYMTATVVAVIRHKDSVNRGFNPDKYGDDGGQHQRLHNNLMGAEAEAVIHKITGLPWHCGEYVKGQPDVGNLEVRGARKHYYNLILHPEDPDDRKFILVTGEKRRYKVHGWIMGRDGKQNVYWREPKAPRPCYIVPRRHLHDIRILLDEITPTTASKD